MRVPACHRVALLWASCRAISVRARLASPVVRRASVDRNGHRQAHPCWVGPVPSHCIPVPRVLARAAHHDLLLDAGGPMQLLRDALPATLVDPDGLACISHPGLTVRSCELTPVEHCLQSGAVLVGVLKVLGGTPLGATTANRNGESQPPTRPLTACASSLPQFSVRRSSTAGFASPWGRAPPQRTKSRSAGGHGDGYLRRWRSLDDLHQRPAGPGRAA